MGGVVDELTAAFDGLAGEDLAPLFGPALLDRLRPLLVAQNRLAAEIARTVRECEVSGAAEGDGLKSMTSWLCGHRHLSATEAARVVRTGRALEHLPGMAAALAAGEVTGGQAGVIARVAEAKPLALAAEQGVDLAVVDAVLTGVATGSPHADTAEAVHHYLDRLDADGPEPDPTEGRRLVIATHADGSITGRFDLDAVGGEKLQTALESVVQAGRCAADERTRSQQQADALVQLCDNQLAAGGLPTLRGHKPQLIVKIGLADLADPATGRGTAEMGFGATISAARARWPACDGQVTRIVMGPDGLPLDYSRTMRLFPPHVRRAAEVRDGGCVFAGCGAPTWWCDGHHLLEWINGGETNLDNAALLCERHSHLVSTTASASSDNPTADGAPGAPTAPRSSSDHSSSTQPPDPTAWPCRTTLEAVRLGLRWTPAPVAAVRTSRDAPQELRRGLQRGLESLGSSPPDRRTSLASTAPEDGSVPVAYRVGAGHRSGPAHPPPSSPGSGPDRGDFSVPRPARAGRSCRRGTRTPR
jgi:hypothetical protein